MPPAIDTRHSEMDKLFVLNCIKKGVTSIDIAILQAEASMEPDDVKLVNEKLKKLDSKKD